MSEKEKEIHWYICILILIGMLIFGLLGGILGLILGFETHNSGISPFALGFLTFFLLSHIFIFLIVKMRGKK